MADQKRIRPGKGNRLIQMTGEAFMGKCGIQFDVGHLIGGVQVDGVG